MQRKTPRFVRLVLAVLSTRNAIPRRPGLSIDAVRARLLDRWLLLAMLTGIGAYLLDTLELWVAFPASSLVMLQIAVEIILVVLTGLAITKWGRRRRLTLFHAGYGLVWIAYLFGVSRLNAFDTPWGDGFIEAFGFYCLFLPVSIRLTAGVGAFGLLTVAGSEALIRGGASFFWRSLTGNLAAFAFLLAFRQLANSSWRREFVATQGELTASRVAAENARFQLEFVSAISHELRSPLTVLCFTSERLQSGEVELQEDVENCYRLLVEESQRLRRRVYGLLEFGKMLGPNHARQNYDLVDPTELINSVSQEFGDWVKARGYTIVTSSHEDTPLIKADARALNCVLWNLLENAVQYSPEHKTIWMEVRRQQAYAVIQVRDRGIGIPEAEQGMIFERYVRGPSSRTYAPTGTGIGLAIVKYIVKAHGGVVRVESILGQGSTFSILLPSAT